MKIPYRVIVDWNGTSAAEVKPENIEIFTFNTLIEAQAFHKGLEEGLGWFAEPDVTVFKGTNRQLEEELDKINEKARV